MWLRKPKHRPIDRQQQLAAVPHRAAEAVAEPTATGGIQLKVPRRGRMGPFRLPPGAVRSFELDEMGAAVWQLCDGETNLMEITQQFAARYGLSTREAEAATTAFLKTLASKQLIHLAAAKDVINGNNMTNNPEKRPISSQSASPQISQGI